MGVESEAGKEKAMERRLIYRVQVGFPSSHLTRRVLDQS